EPGLAAAGAVLDYLKETQRASLTHLDRLTPFSTDDALQIDESTRRSLEIHRRLRDGEKAGSLLGVLDETTTAMGSRLLSEWAGAPLTHVKAIDARLDAVQEFAADSHWTADVRAILYETYDLQRLLARVATGRASPRDLSFVGRTLQRLPRLKAKLTGRKSTRLTHLENELDLLPELRAELDRALCDDCPLHANEGGFVREGYNEQLDKLRELAAGGKQWIAEYQAQEITRTGIPNLKVGYNKVFGYYIEITQSQYGKVPQDYIRKQTVKNAERYITPDLKTYEEQVLTAVERSTTLENEIFLQLRERTAQHAGRLQATARALAEIDVLAGLASLATRRGWTRPRMVDEPVLEIVDGRHPVLDAILPEGSFVPNDAKLGGEHGLIALITGPNMAGKSTYIRQTALITFLAQLGSFVPAKSAVIGVADRIFARVGASDELSRGQSTFMVEMTETARILHTATPSSLIILDEVGRGTSTYDGVSLAWSIVEHLHNVVGARTFFATHYHELTQLADELPHMRNYTVAVREWKGEVVFLHKITPGAADKSYGLHVAQLAGVPPEVIARASAILKHLEADHVPAEVRFQPVKRRAKKIALEGQKLLFFGEGN
ncbi:MAG TPA: DNA mismatch repair protein MutS, partial [Pirellulales bacterium]